MNNTVDKNKIEIQSIIMLIGILIIELIKLILIIMNIFIFIIYEERNRNNIDKIIIIIEYLVIFRYYNSTNYCFV